MFRTLLVSQLATLIGTNIQIALAESLVEGRLIRVGFEWIEVREATSDYENEESTNFIPIDAINYVVDL